MDRNICFIIETRFNSESGFMFVFFANLKKMFEVLEIIDNKKRSCVHPPEMRLINRYGRGERLCHFLCF